MELDPHQLIEGIVICCYAVGAVQAFLYVRGEMALAQERVAQALNDAYANGMVGKNILGTDFSVDITLTWGAGAYIVGEETGLIESLEGNRGMPRLKPPFFPAAKGLYLQPTIVNNVETLSNLPWIVANGGDAYKAIGSEASPGMRMFAVSGHVNRPGVFEVVQGITTFRQLIEAPEYCNGLRAGSPAEGVHPRRRVGAVVHRGADRPPARQAHRRPGRLDARLGCHRHHGRHHRHGEGVLAHRALLRPRELRQVHAVPRGHDVAGARSCKRIIDGYGRPSDLDLLLDVADNISPGLTWPPRQTTICVLGPSATAPMASALNAVPRRVRVLHRARAVGGRRPGAEVVQCLTRRPRRRRRRPSPSPSTAATSRPSPASSLIAAAQRTGTYIPRFCYHERMESVGMCRMCLVDVDTGRGPALAVSCMTNVAEGMKVDTFGPRVKKAQEGVLEFLLINHPLDCPVCDKGGECPLQDQTLSHGPGESRFVEEKRHYAKPIPISDVVYLDRERCILCDRCTRFAKEVAGDPLIQLHLPGQPDADPDLPRRAVRVVLQRQHRADLPRRRPHRQAVPVQGPPVGPRDGGEHVHDVLGRLPHHGGVEPRPAAALPGHRRRRRQLGLDVRPRPLQLRSGQQRGPAGRPARAQAGERGRRAGRGVVVRGHRRRRRRHPRRRRRRRPRRGGRARRRPGHQRGRLRLGQAGQGRHRHRPRRRPARRRPARRAPCSGCRRPRSTRSAPPRPSCCSAPT